MLNSFLWGLLATSSLVVGGGQRFSRRGKCRRDGDLFQLAVGSRGDWAVGRL